MEKKYDHQIHEPRLKQLWQDSAVYALDQDQLDSRPLFSIDTPPPTVSGSLHIGHIFSYTHTDLIARYKRMNGFAVFYPFGFDDNGLPTERFVEKKRSVTAYSLGRSAFIQLCLEETVAVEKKFQELWQTMGLSIDWKHWYSTIDARTRKISQSSFIELFKKKYAYRKQEPALYCTSCYTSVAQAELEDVQQQTYMNTLTFKTDLHKDVQIATTRPEFLASCVAVLYHPDDIRYQDLKGHYAIVPLYGTRVPFVADDTVKMDKGSGLVMCCAFGDSHDVEWIKKHNFAYTQILQKDGRFSADLAYSGGLKVKPAREKIVLELTQQNILVKREAITHSVNIHERCKHEIEFLSLSQWFIDIKSHKDILLKMGSEVAWHPTYMKTRYDDWVNHINWDWCISRQRFFGIPFPCWHCTQCNHVILASEDQLPIDPQETPYTKPCPHCGSTDIVPDMDVMDTWNTSSLTPKICKQLFESAYGTTKQFLPMSMRPQAHDIIRTWAFDTIVKSWMHDKQIPWNDIVISGHVLTTDKQKISKSQGNSPLEPENLLKTYAADIIRYWTAGAQLGTDTAFSENQLKIGQRLLVKLWNACLFIKEHARPETQKPLALSDREAIVSNGYVRSQDPLNQWILHRATQTFAAYQRAFDAYHFHKALEVVEQFFWQDFCDNYLELVKDRFFNEANYPQDLVAETRAVLHQLGFELLQWYAPFLPYITETIYQELYLPNAKTASLHQTTYVSGNATHDYPAAVASITLLLEAVQQVRKFKTDANLSLKTDLTALTVVCDQQTQTQLSAVEKVLAGVARTPQIIYAPIAPQPAGIYQEHDTYSMVITL